MSAPLYEERRAKNSTLLFGSSPVNLVLGSAKRLSHGLSQKVKSPIDNVEHLKDHHDIQTHSIRNLFPTLNTGKM